MSRDQGVALVAASAATWLTYMVRTLGILTALGLWDGCGCAIPGLTT